MKTTRKKRYEKPKQSGFFINDIHPKNASQQFYLDCLIESRVTFCLGPAGTGKTYIAAYVALQKLFEGSVKKIIITRPLVATEDIGYLPGTLEEKIHPYLLPLLDAFEDHIGPTKTLELVEDHTIEVCPLAFMRGRSLNNSFLILDEAQNVTREQMKMFLTRIGYKTSVAVNGDSSQSDLDKPLENGLSWAVDRLSGVHSDIAVAEFSRSDIVRDPLIETMLINLEGRK